MATQSELPFPASDPANETDRATGERPAEDAGPAVVDQRAHLRFDKMFAVRVESLRVKNADAEGEAPPTWA